MQIGIYAYITMLLFVSASNFLINLIQSYWILTNPGRVTGYLLIISAIHISSFAYEEKKNSVSFLYEKTSKRGALKYYKSIQYPANKNTEGNLPTRGGGRGTLFHSKLQQWSFTLTVAVGPSCNSWFQFVSCIPRWYLATSFREPSCSLLSPFLRNPVPLLPVCEI